MSKTQSTSASQKISQLFRVLGQPTHLDILLAIGTGEACVCHLEAMTGWRQAYISQHLMALRSEGLVVSRRDGRNVFYRLRQASILDLIRKAAGVVGMAQVKTAQSQRAEPLSNCACPTCSIQTPPPRLREASRLAGGNS